MSLAWDPSWVFDTESGRILLGNKTDSLDTHTSKSLWETCHGGPRGRGARGRWRVLAPLLKRMGDSWP